MKTSFIESLSDLQHAIWSRWMDYMFSKGEFKEDGTWIMPKWAVDRWQRQLKTNYKELSEAEKESDREIAIEIYGVFIKK